MMESAVWIVLWVATVATVAWVAWLGREWSKPKEHS